MPKSGSLSRRLSESRCSKDTTRKIKRQIKMESRLRRNEVKRRKRERDCSSCWNDERRAKSGRRWIPAFAGMTSRKEVSEPAKPSPQPKSKPEHEILRLDTVEANAIREQRERECAREPVRA